VDRYNTFTVHERQKRLVAVRLGDGHICAESQSL
jgi:hypothetical protein